MTTATVDDLTTRLETLLAVGSNADTRTFWERYLKGEAQFRGVPMAGVRSAVRTLWRHSALDAWPTPDLLALAHRWFRQPMTEDKLAAVLLLAEHCVPRLTLRDADALAWPLAKGHIADWNVCDWYAMKTLDRYITGHPTELKKRAEAVASWSTAATLWQRRAAVVAFVRLAARTHEPFPGFTDLMLEACAANLVSEDRFAHTGPGWLLRELSHTAPEPVARFVRDHPELSREATRMATARLRAGPYRRR